MLSFEVSDDGISIQVCCNPEGLDSLISILKKIKINKIDHTHIKSPSAGGKVLSDKIPGVKEHLPR